MRCRLAATKVAMKVTEIWRYPVKTMAGEKLQRVRIGALGILCDGLVSPITTFSWLILGSEAVSKPTAFVTIANRVVDSLLRFQEAFKGFEEQRKLLAALTANLQVLLDEVIRFFDRTPLESQLGETAHFSQALVAGQLLIPRAAEGLQKGTDLFA